MTDTPVLISSGLNLGRYGNNQNCDWLLATASNTLRISFTNFSTEAGYDFVEVFSGTRAAQIPHCSACAGASLARYTGGLAPFVLDVVVDPFVLLRFTSDSSQTAPGFSALVSAVPLSSAPVEPRCSGITNVAVQSTSVFISDGPGDYATNTNCAWTITGTAPPFELTFRSLGLETNYDWVKIYERGSLVPSAEITGYNYVGRFYTINYSPATIRFTSDGSVNAAGFEAAIRSVPGLVELGTPPPFTAPVAAPPSAPCSGRVSVPVTLFVTPVTISDGPGNYASNTQCEWVLSSSTSALTISFSSFSTEPAYDKVDVFSGTSPSGASWGTYSGTLSPFVVPVASKVALLRFVSDGSVTFAGFTALVSPA